MTQDAFQTEATALRPILIAEARHLLHDNDGAEDAVQDALLRLWQVCDTLHSPMTALAHVVVRNVCLNRLRSLRPTTPISETDAIDDRSNADDRQTDINRMMDVIATLPPLQQLLLRLRHMSGLDSAAIARLTGMSPAAVRKALSRARLAVRVEYLKKYQEEQL